MSKELNNNLNNNLDVQKPVKQQSVDNSQYIKEATILQRLQYEENVKDYEIPQEGRQEFIDKLSLVLDRTKEWQLLKDSQFRIQDLYRLEKYKIALLLNNAKDIQYLQSSEGLNYSVEHITNQGNEQKLLILLRHAEKMPLLKGAGQSGKILFQQEERILYGISQLSNKLISLLLKRDPKSLIHTINDKISHQAMDKILEEKNSLIERREMLEFNLEEDIRKMDPARLDLLFEYINQIHYLQKLGFANKIIINESNIERLKFLLIEGERALEIAYHAPLTYDIMLTLDEKRLNMLFNNIEGAKILLQSSDFRENIRTINIQRLSVLLSRSQAVGELVKAGLSATHMSNLDDQRLNLLLKNVEGAKRLFQYNCFEMEGSDGYVVSIERLSILFMYHEDVRDLIEAGFDAEFLIKGSSRQKQGNVSLDQLKSLLAHKGEVCYLLKIDMVNRFQDQDFIKKSLSRTRLELVLRDVKITEDYIKVSPSFTKERILGFNHPLDPISEKTLQFLLDRENSKKLLYLLGETFEGERFDFEAMIAEGNRVISETMLKQYDATLSLLNNRNHFTVTLLEGARAENKLALMLNNVAVVQYLRRQNFTPEEIVSMNIESLQVILSCKEKQIKGLMDYGFDKPYLLDQRININLFRLLVKNTDVLLIFNGANVDGRNGSGCTITGLHELILNNQSSPEFYTDLKWLFGNHAEIIGLMKILNKTELQIGETNIIPNIRQTMELLKARGEVQSDRGDIFGMTDNGTLKLKSINCKDYQEQSGWAILWNSLQIMVGFKEEDDAQTKHNLKALTVTRRVERTLSTKLDRAFDRMFMKDVRGRVVLQPAYILVQDFLFETIVNPIVQLLDVTRKVNGKPLGMVIFEYILISGINGRIMDNQQIQAAVTQVEESENDTEMKSNIEIAEMLKNRRIAYEQDQMHFKYKENGELKEGEAFPNNFITSNTNNADKIVTIKDPDGVLLLRFVIGGLFGRNIAHINKRCEAIDASQLTEVQIEEIKQDVYHISESTGFER